MTAVEYRRAVDRAERDEVRQARREEIFAAKKAREVSRREKDVAVRDGFQEYEAQSKKTQHSNTKTKQSASEQERVSTQYKLHSMRGVREGKNKQDLETDQIENKKINAKLNSEMRDAQAKTAKQIKHENSMAQTGGFRALKQERVKDAEAERQLLAKSRVEAQTSISAKNKADFEQKAILLEQRKAEIEALRNVKRGKMENEEFERAILAKERETSQVDAKAKVTKAADEKALMKNQKQGEIEALRNVKRGKMENEELERAILAKERETAQVDAKQRTASSFDAKAAMKEHRLAEIEGVRNIKRGKSVEREKEIEVLANERAMSLSLSVQREESAARDKALAHAHAQGEVEGRRHASQQRVEAQSVTGVSSAGGWGGRSGSSASSSRYTALKVDEAAIGTPF